MPGFVEAAEYFAERFLAGQDDAEEAQARATAGRLRSAGTGPDVQRETVREGTTCTEIREAELRRVDVLVEADQIAVEAKRRLETGDEMGDETGDGNGAGDAGGDIS